MFCSCMGRYDLPFTAPASNHNQQLQPLPGGKMISAVRKTRTNHAISRQFSSLRAVVFTTVLLVAFTVSLLPPRAAAADNFCTQTANLIFTGCGHSAEDDFLVASA